MHQREFLIIGLVILALGAFLGRYAAQSHTLSDNASTQAVAPSGASGQTDAGPVATVSDNMNATVIAVQVQKMPENKTYTDIMQDADRERRANRWELAIKEYDKAIALEPNSAEARLARGQAWLKLFQPAQALDDFNAVLSRNARDSDASSLKVQATIMLGRFGEALAQTRDKTAGEMTYYHAVLQCSASQFDPCEKELNAIVQKHPGTDVSRRGERVLKALREFKLFSDGDEAHRSTLVAQALTDVEECTLAERLLNKIVLQVQDYRDPWILLGYVRYILQRYDEALDALKRAQGLDQKKPETAYYLGLVSLKLGNKNAAMEHFASALNLGYGSRLDAQKYLSDTAVEMGDYDTALRYYLAIVNEGITKDITAYVRPMWIYIEIKKQPDKALALAQQAYAKYPATAMGYNLLGWANLASGNVDGAYTALSEALKRDPNLQAVHLNLGDLYARRGNVALAKQEYKQAYALDPNSAIGVASATKHNALP